MLRSLPAAQWNFHTAAHLLNRAGFGGTPDEIEACRKQGLEAAVDELVDYERVPDTTPPPAWAKSDPDRVARFQEFRQATPTDKMRLKREFLRQESERVVELRGWWLERMARGPRPLQEKLTLFWHGHFATSMQKVRDAYLMWRQNETFREHASGRWLDLLTAVTRDPAMLVWLDQAQSRKQHPNENYAREVMELFTLGEGHYSERDVAEAARAFTGLTYDRANQVATYRPQQHDDGVKTVLGQTGRWGWEDILRFLVAQPVAPRFITSKLWSFFAGEPPTEALAQALADEFVRAGQQFKPLLRAMFRTEAFYASNLIRNQIKSPVQWLVGSVRLLGRPCPPPAASARLLALLGQDLFAPPNVKGWDGGTAWITTNTLLTRYNAVEPLITGHGSLHRDGEGKPRERRHRAVLARPGHRNATSSPVNFAKLFSPEDRQSPERLIVALERRFIQGSLKPAQVETLRQHLRKLGHLDGDDLPEAVRLIMSTPEYQLA